MKKLAESNWTLRNEEDDDKKLYGKMTQQKMKDMGIQELPKGEQKSRKEKLKEKIKESDLNDYTSL